MTERLTLTQPDDWHLHLRDGALLQAVAPHTARRFARAIIMPNLVPPVTEARQALAYRQRILEALGPETGFTPLMTLYCTDRMGPETVREAADAGVTAFKLYPAGATTNSDSGVTRIENLYPALEAMSEAGLPLLVHGEVTHPEVDIFDREKRFIEQVLEPVTERFPALKVVFEHVTTEDAVQFVSSRDQGMAATITPQHLLFDRNAMLVGGIRPHLYCLPVLKRRRHQLALRRAATSGDPRFFLGTDSAPHSQDRKETSCGCAGCFSAPAAIELYAEVFEAENALDRLEAFASFHGPDFYGLPRNRTALTLVREPWTVPASLPLEGQQQIVPLMAGETLQWRLENATGTTPGDS